ncbi:hypothetical protein [Sulfuracidifex metallicus]|jgi:hypothetical protein|uniref:CRISPR type III-B/RAMP module-associated protein Cmr5 n=1 Tax=Sulfuracidifex metallicus DSM 6482 = JCM 9184 TaxID=523847 RepID=A0A6A9QRU7_SULME|nr:hypothetical protein [Sulfuracidifex metallicus]MUN29911.1 hypothetical protein [Sulfuracidifex metallicus DSM 6482 = JCM 9184]WOE51704.1 hypothetical protein RQ359_001030 [Sulfuracidifex metallicus DSM 6482 = JCM 9184]
MASVENEAKKIASTYARWLRNPEDALFGKGGEGCVSAMYKRIKEAHTKDEIREILNLSQYQMERNTMNDLTRFINDLNNKINPMSDEEAVKFVIEVFRYFQIALATKLHDMNRGLWM